LDLLASWQRVVDHTQDHFDREDRWMGGTRFSSSNCRTMLGQWFLHHAQSMDAALALHLRNAG
jgi:hemerythrin